MIYAALLVSLAAILCGAGLFTNSVEWLGEKLHLGQGAVGSLLAAVGTALPETMIPVIAILFGNRDFSDHIGIGAILGAPFMLATLALPITGLAALAFKIDKRQRTCMLCDLKIINRDLCCFIFLYALALGASFLPAHDMKTAAALILVLSYGAYAFLTLRDDRALSGQTKIASLLFAQKAVSPSLILILLQLAAALAAIIAGAHFFVGAIAELSILWSVPALILTVIIAPIATEMPEKFNSIIWIRQGKDTLALGNITGAMVFQSSLIPALGILLTPWDLSALALLSGFLALLSSGIIAFSVHRHQELKPGVLLAMSSLYLVYLGTIFLTGGML